MDDVLLWSPSQEEFVEYGLDDIFLGSNAIVSEFLQWNLLMYYVVDINNSTG